MGMLDENCTHHFKVFPYAGKDLEIAYRTKSSQRK